LGKPVVAGTRITVELILEKLAAGETMETSSQRIPPSTPMRSAPPYGSRLTRCVPMSSIP